jgi:hypothetical protein
MGLQLNSSENFANSSGMSIQDNTVPPKGGIVGGAKHRRKHHHKGGNQQEEQQKGGKCSLQEGGKKAKTHRRKTHHRGGALSMYSQELSQLSNQLSSMMK